MSRFPEAFLFKVQGSRFKRESHAPLAEKELKVCVKESLHQFGAPHILSPDRKAFSKPFTSKIYTSMIRSWQLHSASNNAI
jgi:hypothetical protein